MGEFEGKSVLITGCGRVRGVGRALSVAFAWLYKHTHGSLLLTMLMHSAVNNIPHFLPSAVTNAKNVFSLHASLVAWLTVVFLWIPAAYFLVRMPKAEN